MKTIKLLFVFLLLFAITTSFSASEKDVLISHASDSGTWWNTIKNTLKVAEKDDGVQVDYNNPRAGEQVATAEEQSAKAENTSLPCKRCKGSAKARGCM